MKKNLPYFVIALLINTILISCENSPEAISALNKKKFMVDEATKVESYLSQGGKVKAKLTAPIMYRVSADTIYTEFPKSLHVDFYNDNKEIETRLDTKYGKYFESLNKVYLRDSVKIITKKGDTLYCHDLWWDQSKDSFYTNKPTQQRSPGQVINGKDGLDATNPTKNFNIKFKTVTGVLPTAEGDIPK